MERNDSRATAPLGGQASGTSFPSPGMVEDVKTMLRAHLVGRADGDLRDVLRRFAMEARSRGVPPERVITVFKEIAQTLPQVGLAKPVTFAVEPLGQAITVLIDEYFR